MPSIIADWDRECYHIIEGRQFSRLVVGEYWADNRHVGGKLEHSSPGGLTPIVAGGYFWANIAFDYEGVSGEFNVGFNINVGGYREWSIVTVYIPFTPEKERYTIWTDKGTFDPRDLGVCTRMGTRKEIQKTNGDVVLADDDADCYHRIA